MRIGQGIDVHPFAAPDTGGELILGGVVIPDGRPLLGHSDADVVAHAVVDALLGALAWGDIGSYVGVDTPDTAGAASLKFVDRVVTDMRHAGWCLENIDVTVIAQQPPLSTHRAAMRAALAEVLAVDLAAVSVKFTTTDRLGMIGRGEGIAASATCLIAAAQR